MNVRKQNRDDPRGAQPWSRPTCFFEDDPNDNLLRRASVEAIGTFLLMLVATGSGLQAQRLGSSAAALGIVLGGFAIAGALIGLIVAFGAVSGGHFNPLITVMQWLGRERSLSCTAAYVLAQSSGALGAALVTPVQFGPAALAQTSLSWPVALCEGFASAGLMGVVFGCSRSGRAATGPFAVGAWLAGAILAAPSVFYANPALALAASFSAGPSAHRAAQTAEIIAIEVLGALVAFAAIRLIFPKTHRASP